MNDTDSITKTIGHIYTYQRVGPVLKINHLVLEYLYRRFGSMHPHFDYTYVWLDRRFTHFFQYQTTYRPLSRIIHPGWIFHIFGLRKDKY